jgi:hypothetical protein
MAFLDNIFNRGAAQQTPPAATPAVPTAPGATQPSGAGPAVKQQAPANPGATPAAMVAGQSGQTPPVPVAEGGGAATGLDAFNDLFKPRPVDPNAPKTPTLQDSYLGPLDETAFQQQVSKTNFVASVSPEVLQKAASGDATALAEAINAAAQAGFAAATKLTHGLVDHGARAAAERVNGTLDSRIRQNQVRTQNGSNEVLAHPAVAPMFAMLKDRIAAQNPSLSPADVAARAEEYMAGVGQAFTGGKSADGGNPQPAPTGTDFSSYLS